MKILRCPECGSSNIKNMGKIKRYCEECGYKFEDKEKKEIVKNKFNPKPLIWGGVVGGIASLGALDK